MYMQLLQKLPLRKKLAEHLSHRLVDLRDLGREVRDLLRQLRDRRAELVDLRMKRLDSRRLLLAGLLVRRQLRVAPTERPSTNGSPSHKNTSQNQIFDENLLISTAGRSP